MFDLDAAIRSWRDAFGESLRAEDLEELSEHLRAQVAELSRGELSEEEAFLVARHRIGRIEQIESEFAKVRPGAAWIEPVEWMVLGFLALTASMAASRLITGVTAWVAWTFDLGTAGSLGLTVLVQLAGIAAVAWVLLRIVPSSLLEGRGRTLACLVFAVFVPLLMLARGAIHLAQIRTLSAHDWSFVVVHQRVVTEAAAVLLPLFLVVVVWRLERRRRTA